MKKNHHTYHVQTDTGSSGPSFFRAFPPHGRDAIVEIDRCAVIPAILTDVGRRPERHAYPVALAADAPFTDLRFAVRT